MTDEELAEEYAKKAFCIAHIHEDELIYRNGFLDGLKAGSPQWHDLEKDPMDSMTVLLQPRKYQKQ